MKLKRVLTVQDVSCIGKCSATVAVPVISALGSECAVLPTAVLSTHTLFKGFTFRDLTQDIPAILEHWKKEKFEFDAIYTGYLGTEEEIDTVFTRRSGGHRPEAVRVREKAARRPVETFRFNPNTVSLDDLMRLGFSEKQAQSIINYREKGGRFRRPADFAKS